MHWLRHQPRSLERTSFRSYWCDSMNSKIKHIYVICVSNHQIHNCSFNCIASSVLERSRYEEEELPNCFLSYYWHIIISSIFMLSGTSGAPLHGNSNKTCTQLLYIRGVLAFLWSAHSGLVRAGVKLQTVEHQVYCYILQIQHF